MKTRIIIVGGFLGAGKTSLLFETAKELTSLGKRVGLITNDQASELVDTGILENEDGLVKEVSGSCFCCNFNGFTQAVSHLIEKKQTEIIIAEPVGSCTDLSATIIQPLKQLFAGSLQLSPFTVLVDPEKLSILLDHTETNLHKSALYIIHKQLEEADIIVINKTDLLSATELLSLKDRVAKLYPLADIMTLSIKDKMGLQQWIGEVMNRLDSGTHLAEVDYDIYAQGEAVLGWLNSTFILTGKQVNWDLFLLSLIQSLSQRFDETNSEVGHVKLLLKVNKKIGLGNITGRKDTINFRGSVGSGNEAKLIVNARVQMNPEELKNVVFNEISKNGNKYNVEVLPQVINSLSPGRPNPTHRFKQVV